MKILVSACLLGEPCRYDAKSKPCQNVINLQKNHTLVAVCPETDGGLCIPREPCENVNGRIISKSGRDCTNEYQRGAEIALKTYKEQGCELAILKAKSPSCSKNGIYDGTFSKTLTQGKMGVTAKLLYENNIPIIDETEIEKYFEGKL